MTNYTAEQQIQSQIKQWNQTIRFYNFFPKKRKQRVENWHSFTDLTLSEQTVSSRLFEKFHSWSQFHYYSNKSLIEHDEPFLKRYYTRMNAFNEAFAKWSSVCYVNPSNQWGTQFLTNEENLEKLVNWEKVENIEKIDIVF